MKDWRQTLIGAEYSIMQAIEIIDKGALQIALVVDADNRLLGTVSDGDVRRGILKGLSMIEPVRLVMNRNPVVIKPETSRETVLTLMQEREIGQIPIVDAQGILQGLEVLQEIMLKAPKPNAVILMAGGAGKRLGNLTEGCPKPLLKVGDKPILETILESFIEHGFRKFYFSVNYRAEMIEEYFGTGERWGVQITYLRETVPLGTAGALYLLSEKMQDPFIVMNGDILTKVNFGQLLDFHRQHQAKATLCVRDYTVQVPYGVVQTDQHRLLAIHEKPVKQFLVSAGIYVFEPEIMSYLSAGERLDMPDFIQTILAARQDTAVFPVREYWIDIGRMDDYEKANCDFAEVFKYL